MILVFNFYASQYFFLKQIGYWETADVWHMTKLIASSIGGLILIILYFMVIMSSLAIAINTKSIFTKLMVIGLISIFFSHVFINIGMVMGMMPVVGVPLPFISYGGTMMVSMLISFGLIMNASIHQHSNLHTN